MLIESPFSTFMILPAQTRSLAEIILRHTKLGLLPIPASLKELEGEYLTLRSLAMNELGSIINFQACFPNIEMLILLSS